MRMDRDAETLLSTGQTDRDMSHPTPAGRARSSVEPPFPFACPRVHPHVWFCTHDMSDTNECVTSLGSILSWASKRCCLGAWSLLNSPCTPGCCKLVWGIFCLVLALCSVLCSWLLKLITTARNWPHMEQVGHFLLLFQWKVCIQSCHQESRWGQPSCMRTKSRMCRCDFWGCWQMQHFPAGWLPLLPWKFWAKKLQMKYKTYFKTLLDRLHWWGCGAT